MNPSLNPVSLQPNSPQKHGIEILPAELVNEILFHLKVNFDDQVNLIEGIFTDQAIKDKWHIRLLQQFYPEAYKEGKLIKDQLPKLRKQHGNHLLPLSALARCVWQRKIIGINTSSPVVKTVYIPIEICQLNSLPPEYPTHEGLLQAAASVGNTELCLWLLEDQKLTASIEAVCRTAVEFGSTETVLALLKWIKANNNKLSKVNYKNIASKILGLAIDKDNERLIEVLMCDWKLIPKPNTKEELSKLFIKAREHRLTLRFDEKILFQTIFKKLTIDQGKKLVESIAINIEKEGTIAFLEDLKTFKEFEEVIDNYIKKQGITHEHMVQSQKGLLCLAIQSGNLKRVVDLHEKQRIDLSIGELVEWISSIGGFVPNITMNYYLKKKANTITDEECDQLFKVIYDNALEVLLDCLQAKSEGAITDWVKFIQNAVSHEEDSMDIIHAYRIKRLSQQSSREKLYDEAMKLAIKEDNFEVVRGLLEDKNIPPLWNEYVVMKQAIKKSRCNIVIGLIETSSDKFKRESFPWENVLYKYSAISSDEVACLLLKRKIFTPTEKFLDKVIQRIRNKHLLKDVFFELPTSLIELLLTLLDQLKMPYLGIVDNYIQFSLNFLLLDELVLQKKYPQILFRKNPQEEVVWIKSILEKVFSKKASRRKNTWDFLYNKDRFACLESLCNLIIHYNIQETLILTGALSDIAEAGRLDLVMELVDYKQQNKLLTYEDTMVLNKHFTLGKSGEAWLAKIFSDVTPNDLQDTSRRKKALVFRR